MWSVELCGCSALLCCSEKFVITNFLTPPPPCRRAASRCTLLTLCVVYLYNELLCYKSISNPSVISSPPCRRAASRCTLLTLCVVFRINPSVILSGKCCKIKVVIPNISLSFRTIPVILSEAKDLFNKSVSCKRFFVATLLRMTVFLRQSSLN